MTPFNLRARPTTRFRVSNKSDSSWELTIEPLGECVPLAAADDATIEYVIPDEPSITRDGVAEIIIHSDRDYVVWLPRFDEFRITNQAGEVILEVGAL